MKILALLVLSGFLILSIPPYIHDMIKYNTPISSIDTSEGDYISYNDILKYHPGIYPVYEKDKNYFFKYTYVITKQRKGLFISTKIDTVKSELWWRKYNTQSDTK